MTAVRVASGSPAASAPFTKDPNGRIIAALDRSTAVVEAVEPVFVGPVGFNIAAITASETPAFFRATRSTGSVLNFVGPLLIFRMITSSPIPAFFMLITSSFVKGPLFWSVIAEPRIKLPAIRRQMYRAISRLMRSRFINQLMIVFARANDQSDDRSRNGEKRRA